MKLSRYIITSAAVIITVFSHSITSAQESVCLQAESIENLDDASLELLLKQCDAEIAAEQARLEETKQETQSRDRDLRISEQNISRSQAYIRARDLEIKKINVRIKEQKARVQTVEQKAEQTRQSISDLIRRKNELDSYSVVEAVFSKDTISGFFDDINNFDIVRNRLQADFKAYEKLKVDIIAEQSELAEEESRQRELAEQKELQKKQLEKTRAEQKVLRDISRETEKQYSQLIAEKEAAKKSLRARLFTTASGQKISFGDAYDIIRPYEKTLGVDAAFILAVLFQESGWGGKIGGNIGQCTYNQFNSHGGTRNGKQVMSASQQANFLTIMSDLGRDASSQKVSCPIPTDGAYGGAMGPAQFMPNTWMEVRSQAARYIGTSPQNMSPFSNRDAFIASGTYLRNHYYSSSCSQYAKDYAHIRSAKSLREKCAAARYYAGGNWFKFRNTYGESVQSRANRFRADIATLND